MQDKRIIELIRNNKSEEGMTALYRNFPAVRKMILHFGGNRQDAEDIFHEALIILCRKIRETDFQLTSQLSTYLYSVCRFLWKDEIKKKNKTVFHSEELKIQDSEEASWIGLAENENRIRIAEKALHELGERCRELLLLFYNGKFKLKDLALKMGYASENSAKNQKYKCMEAAKNKLKELLPEFETI